MSKHREEPFDWETKIVFELGTLILALLTAEIESSNYSDNYTINEGVLDAKLELLNQKYPKSFIALAIDDMLKPTPQRVSISSLRLACEKEFGNKMSFDMSRTLIDSESVQVSGRKDDSQNSNNASRQSVQLPAQSTPVFVSRTTVASINNLPRSSLEVIDSSTHTHPQGNSRLAFASDVHP